MTMRETWRGVRVALVVDKQEVDAHRVAAAVKLLPELTTDASRIESAADRWTWNVSKGEGDTLENQVLTLVTQIRPRRESLMTLQRDGYAVHVDIAGTAGTGSPMVLRPAVLAELASLGVPVTVTCLSPTGSAEPDPLSWLDA
ncbi:hypothetical protein [Streptomyces sp. NPDC005533]|uniref:hypothetical protein n=1 Tax=Streptomyces sp. NPDC005533 TaxID=3364723 RepID=UPI0036761453